MGVRRAALERGYGAIERARYRAGLHRPQFARRNAVVMYHSVREAPNVRPGTGDVSVAEFRRQLAYFTGEFEVVDLPEMRGEGGAKRIALTFDDGYRDVYTNVRPLLYEFDVPATVFVIADYLDGPDRRERVTNTGHQFDALTAEQLAELAGDPLVTIGNTRGPTTTSGDTTSGTSSRRR